MRRFVWWLRSAFCKHEWLERGKTKVHSLDEHGKPWSALPQYTMCTKECAKCGWIWRQRI